MVRSIEEHIKQSSTPKKLLDEIGQDKSAYFRKMYATFVEDFRKKFLRNILSDCENQTEKLIAFYESNLDDLLPTENGAYCLDRDVKELGIPNRHPDLTEKCISILDDPALSSLGQRILQRYTDPSFNPASQWKAWWNANKWQLRYDRLKDRFAVQ